MLNILVTTFHQNVHFSHVFDPSHLIFTQVVNFLSCFNKLWTLWYYQSLDIHLTNDQQMNIRQSLLKLFRKLTIQGLEFIVQWLLLISLWICTTLAPFHSQGTFLSSSGCSIILLWILSASLPLCTSGIEVRDTIRFWGFLNFLVAIVVCAFSVFLVSCPLS